MAVSSPLLTTKLFIPPTRSELVSRARLVQLLQKGAERKLTLICAPPGFGKTTLVAEWHQTHPQKPLAWLSLDEADNEPIRFLRYLVAAFNNFSQLADDTIIQTLLNSAQPIAVETILTSLINRLTSFFADQKADHLFLVLDDYHLIHNEVIHTALTFLLDHQPPQLHLIITSRVDPLLPLSRLRARNQLLEIRAVELRFQVNETAAFVRQDETLKEALASEDIAQLTYRTEGWAVGLQLALLWLKGRDDRAAALKTFSGNNRFVLDYLAEEVLAHQSELIRNFLLQTALFKRFNASLASAISGLEWSEENLAQLEKANLFLVPLDDQGEWYRYHHLFAEFLQHRLKREFPGQLTDLHLKASYWFEQNNLLYEAIEHALAAPDFHRSASLIENIIWSMIEQGELMVLEGWLAKIPQSVLYAHPYLCLYISNALFLKGRLNGLEELLRVAEQELKATQTLDKLQDFLHTKMHLARARNNLAETMDFTAQTLALLPPDQVSARAVAGSAPAQVYLNQGEVNQALPFADLLLAALNQEESLLGRLFPGFILGELYLLQGRLALAVETQQEVIKIATAYSIPSILSYLRLGSIYLEWNELDQAQFYLGKVEELLNQSRQSNVPPGYYMYSGLWWPDGDALPVIDWNNATTEQIEIYWRDSFEAQIDCFKARFRRNSDTRRVELEKWAAITFPAGFQSLKTHLEYQREPQYLTVARVLLYQDQFEEALRLLEALKELAQTQGRLHHLIKIMVIMSLAYQAAYKANPARSTPHKTALLCLREALEIAEPGGYILVFLEEGAALQGLFLQLLPSLGESNPGLAFYAEKILKAFGVEPVAETSSLNNQVSPLTANSTGNNSLPEPLSERELEVLRLLVNGASNQEIADHLVVTISTVKKHITNIFGKLGVTRRTQVLLRSMELGLI